MTQNRVHDYPVDDGAVFLGRLKNGTLATLHVAYNCPDTYPRRRLELIGTRAMAVATDTMGQTSGGSIELIHANDGLTEVVRVPTEDDRCPFLVQIESFSEAILSGEVFPFSPARDVAHLQLLLNALSGKPLGAATCL